MRKNLLIVVALTVFALSSFSIAEDGENAENELSPTKMNAVVVTATRSDQEIKKVPANVTVITEQDIQESNAKVISDLLRTEEGVVVRDLLGHGKTSQVDLRGFGETGPYNTLVMVDGRRVNSIDLSGTDWTQIPIGQVERIEIVRGTGSVLYGDNAVGGVINIITKVPSKEAKVKGKATIGSFRRDQQEVYISGGYKALTGSIFADQNSTDGYRHDNEFKAWDVGGKLFFDPTDTISFHLNGSYHEDEFDLPGPLTYAQQKADRKDNKNIYDKGKTKDYFITTGFDLNMGTVGSLVSDVSYRAQESSAEFPDPGYPYESHIENETWSFTPRYVWNGSILGHDNTFITGVDLYWGDMKLDVYSGTPFSPFEKTGITDVSRDSLGFYFNNEFSVLKNLIVSFGARHERVKYDFYSKDLTGLLAALDADTKESENAYSFGLTYLYNGDSSVFARVNRSFRFALLDELVFQDWTGLEIRLNPDLGPQTGIHYEAGIRHYFTSDIRANITYFRSEIENEIYYNPVTFMNENHPETLHQGVEMGAYADVCKFFTLFGNYTYERSTFETHPYKYNDIPAIPRHKGSVGFKIHDIVPGLIFSTDWNYVGSSYAISDQANDFDRKDAYYTLNAMLSYEWKMLKIFAGINNVTNKKYSEYVVMNTFLTQRNFYPAPERNYFGGITLEF